MASQIEPGGKIAVIGAGIVGVCCAAELSDAGYQVTLIDRAKPGIGGPSRVNAGHIAGASILPLASPATFKNIPSLLLDPQSPLIVPQRYGLRILPWLYHFAFACRTQTYMNGVRALADLNSMLWGCTNDLYARAGISGQLSIPGALFLYETEHSFHRAQEGWRLSEKFGVKTDTVTAERLGELEPNLALHYFAAVRADSWGVVSDPLKIVEGIADYYAIGKGANLIHGSVSGVTPKTNGVAVRLDTGERYLMDGIVIAAGAWSKHLTRQLNERIPLEVERGYNVTSATSDTQINHALVFTDRGMVATQLSNAIRVGGLDELGGLHLAENPALHQRVRDLAEEFVLNFDASNATSWMGHRPSMPDSLPVIGQAKISNRILYAFGHGHYGLTHAPATGRLITELAQGHSPAINLHPFSSKRF